MGVYSISDLARLTGISSHTLRVWEKRYALLQPQRTESNTRYYLAGDLRRLVMIAALHRKGMRISRIAELAPEELEQEYRIIGEAESASIHRLKQALIDMDVLTVEEILDDAIRLEGFESALTGTILPLLGQMEIMWLAGTIEEAHEAFFREQIRRKTIRAIDALPRPAGGRRYILLLPKGNQQELNHLFMHYFLRRGGIEVTDLGCEIQVECALSAARRCQAEGILVVNEDPVHWKFGQFIASLAERTELPIIISGTASQDDWSRFGGRVIVLEDVEETIRYVSAARDQPLPGPLA